MTVTGLPEPQADIRLNAEVAAFFSVKGEVERVGVAVKQHSGYVLFKTAAGAAAALELNDSELRGAKLSVVLRCV